MGSFFCKSHPELVCEDLCTRRRPRAEQHVCAPGMMCVGNNLEFNVGIFSTIGRARKRREGLEDLCVLLILDQRPVYQRCSFNTLYQFARYSSRDCKDSFS